MRITHYQLFSSFKLVRITQVYEGRKGEEGSIGSPNSVLYLAKQKAGISLLDPP